MGHHLFISHASEDKDAFVRPLAEALRKRGIRVWYDEFDLKIGDGLRTSIDRGLAESSFGLVILSPSFFGKKWTNRELDGLVSREIAEGRNLILPVWYHTSFEEVARYSPTLANTVALKYNEDIESLVSSIADRFNASEPYLQLSGEHRVSLTSADGSTARWHMRRTVQVGLAPLAEMELRVSTKAVIYPVSFFPGEFAGYEDIGGVRMVKVRFSPEMHPGEVFTQEWVFDTINMYSEEYNAAIVSPRSSYEHYRLFVETDHPGSIGEVRAFKKVGLGEVDLGPVTSSELEDRFEINILNPEVGVTHFLMWKRLQG